MNKILSICLVLALLVTSIVLLNTKENAGAQPPDSESGVAQIGGAFTLTDANGKKVSDAQFRGKYMLVFFGFTRCPDICPVTMASITGAMEMLGGKAADVAPVFITVDPKYDTPAQMKKYLSHFDKRIVGLTGTEEQIKSAAAAYKAYYAEKEPEHSAHGAHGDREGGGQEGGVDHSSFLYLMDKNGAYITHFPYDVAPDTLAKTLKEKIG